MPDMAESGQKWSAPVLAILTKYNIWKIPSGLDVLRLKYLVGKWPKMVYNDPNCSAIAKYD